MATESRANSVDPTAIEHHLPVPLVNVGETERVLSVIVGAVLVAGGAVRMRLSGLAMAALGGALAYRGLTGRCHVFEALGISTTAADHDGSGFMGTDVVDPESATAHSGNVNGYGPSQLDKERFEKLKSAQTERGRDEGEATEVAAAEVKELRRREGRSKEAASTEFECD